jgi:nucleotide-binding universal stress UspA family protein
MSRVLAAVDGTAASPGVLAVARELARVLGSAVDVIHVVDEGRAPAPPPPAVEDAELTLRLLEGPVGAVLVSEASTSDVDAVVVGIRRTVGGPRTTGHIALEVIDHADAIVVAVPPATPSSFELRTVLVPVQPRPPAALERVIRLARGAELEVVILHVHDESSIPAFEDQPHYDVEAWADEFLARWVPGARPSAVLDLRVGAPDEEILRAARDCGAQMIALGWDRDRSAGRATVVTAALARSPLPVALLPLPLRDATSLRSAQGHAAAGPRA